MTKRTLFIAVILLFSMLVNAKVIEQNSVKSKILNRNVSYSVYFPKGYDSDLRSYPVIYLLHGYKDDQTTWINNGNIAWYADAAIEAGKIPPVIIIMPDAGVSMYVNSFDGKNNYEDFFIKEFMPTVENLYRIKQNKYSRGITGHSMGGWGCLLYALKYPDLFIATAPMSAGIHDDKDIVTYDDQKWETVFGSIFGSNIKGTERLNEYWYKNSILKIVEEKTQAELQKVKIRISCGDQDYLLKGSLLLHFALNEKNVNHQLRVKEGAHTWSFWRSDITDVLEFITCNF
ncbi:esterase [Paludibacter propionicigenes WB4]|uniref:Esterase n=1 Tax=Paludibacter propionicigenes (strain DSM 17365 / JCM 13257 / WB4) TaxID=694427 RepID=E4T2V8_PALPW|nr:alpha/beta hydrolase family protein [Paludibacter propionicigenes]ADQ79052.1 esterase [Paludibacter propionicigenes WB4]